MSPMGPGRKAPYPVVEEHLRPAWRADEEERTKLVGEYIKARTASRKADSKLETARETACKASGDQRRIRRKLQEIEDAQALTEGAEIPEETKRPLEPLGADQ